MKPQSATIVKQSITGKKQQVFRLRELGFEGSYKSGNSVKVKCFQCEAAVINDVACHEQGCPARKHECNGCNAIIPFNQRYCADCA